MCFLATHAICFPVLILLGAVTAAFIGLRFDLRRRKLSANKSAGWTFLTAFDVGCVALTIGVATGLFLASPYLTRNASTVLLLPTLGVVGCALALLFLWAEGKSQVQVQRPTGIVFAEWAILVGIFNLLAILVYHSAALEAGLTTFASICLLTALPIGLGVGTLALIIPPFMKGHEEHRILSRVAAQGEFIQSEWVSKTQECPFPERWHMLDAQSAETEVLDLLKALIVATKPDLIVETGTFIGHSAIKMAEGLRQNGFGRLITIEYDPKVFAKAKENIKASGLESWIECRNASSLDSEVEGVIDILYSDSDVNIRESEVRRFLPQIKPRGLVLIHDASSYFKVVREAALRLEEEGLLSVILFSTARGLMIAQKREGRT